MTPDASAPRAARARGATIAGALGVVVAIVLVALAAALHRAYAWSPSRGIGFAAGIATASLIVALAAYVIPKRAVRARLRRRDPAARLVVEKRPSPRSRTRIHLWIHLGIGALLPAVAIAHAGIGLRATPGGALAAALLLAVGFGVLAALCYRAIPRALTRLERRGTLPEDLATERDALEARLFRGVTGKSDRVKAVADLMLVPYASSRLGALALVASGRGLADEARRLRERIDRTLEGRVIEGLDELIAIAIELRALPARRALSWLLRVWPPLHAIAGAAACALLVVHIVIGVLR